MKKFLTIFCITLMLNSIAEAQCPPGAYAYLSVDPACPTGCSVLLLGWPEGTNVNVYGGSPLSVITSTLIDGTLGGPGTGNGYSCVPCNQTLVFASAIPNATGGCVIVNIGVVPVKLTDFAVSTMVRGRKTLSWTSSQEIGPVKYVIEKSSDGLSFQGIATIPARQQASNHYSYSDNGLSTGNSYYRIKVIEVSGAITYSKTILLKNSDEFAISTFPNPVQSGFKVQIPSQHLPATVEILNAQGQHVFLSQTTMAYTQINQPLAKGVYIIKVTSNKNTTVTQRLIKN